MILVEAKSHKGKAIELFVEPNDTPDTIMAKIPKSDDTPPDQQKIAEVCWEFSQSWHPSDY